MRFQSWHKSCIPSDRSKREFFWNLGGLWEWRAMTGDGGFVVLSVWPLCCYFCGMYTNIHTVSYNVFLTDCVHTHRYVWTRNVRSVSGWVSTINIQSIYKIFTFSVFLNVVWFSSWRWFIASFIFLLLSTSFFLKLSLPHLRRGNW